MPGFSFISYNNFAPGQIGVGLSSIVGPTGSIGPTGAQAIVAASLDAFSRLRVSTPYTLFDSQNRYKISGDFDTYMTGSSSVTYSTGTSMVFLNIGTGANDKIIRETYKVFPYQPGKSLLIMTSFVFNPSKTNLVQQVGYYGTNNGIFLKLIDNQIYIVKRVENTGDILIPRSSWNCDPLDGTGYSGIILDLTKVQILFIDIEWLGSGSVRVGFLINDQYIFAHIFNHANVISSTYMATACLPVRYEIFNNNSVTSSNSTLYQICSTVMSEGGYQGKSIKRYASNSTTTINVSTSLTPLISIRLRSDRLDSIVIPSQADLLLASSSTIQYKLIYKGSVTGGTWVNYGNDSNVEYNITPNTITGGTSVDEAYMTSSSQIKSTLAGDSFAFDLSLGRTISGVSDTLTICAISFSGTATVAASLGWYELI
jgi:hypothetical protein